MMEGSAFIFSLLLAINVQLIQTKQGYFNTSTNNTIYNYNQQVNSFTSTIPILNITDSQYGNLNPEIHKTKQQQNISYATLDEQSDNSQFRGSKNKQQINQFNQEENNQQLIQTTIEQVEQTYHPQKNKLILRNTTLSFLKQANYVILKLNQFMNKIISNIEDMEQNNDEQQVYEILMNPQTHKIISEINQSLQMNEARD